MKRPVIESATKRLVAICLGWLFLSGSGWVEAQDNAAGHPAPKSSRAANTPPASGSKAGKKSKKSQEQNAPSETPHSKQPKEIPFPLTPNEPARQVKIPETDPNSGTLLSMLMAAEITRLDNEHVQIKAMNLDLYHPDGKEDFHVVMPTSIFNLTTRIITSEDPVTVKTQDFELTGERMEFNTVERTGRLMGKVRMLVHNLKQVAGQAEQAPKSE